jgi:benzoyl-CoA 2,3-dioxygenase component B
MNEVHRDGYIEDCAKGVAWWNKILEKHGMEFRLYLPHRRFHRHVGLYAGQWFDPQGNPLTEEQWNARKDEWLPSPADKEYIGSLQSEPVYERGKMANWIAPPEKGINGMPVDFEYVRTES